MGFWNSLANGLGRIFWNKKGIRYNHGIEYQYVRRAVAVFQYLVKKGKKPVKVLENEDEFLRILGYKGTLKTLFGVRAFKPNNDVKNLLKAMEEKVKSTERKSYSETYFYKLYDEGFGRFTVPHDFKLFLHDVWLWRSNMLRNIRNQLARIEKDEAPRMRTLYTRWDKHDELEREREHLVTTLTLLRARLQYKRKGKITPLLRQVKQMHPPFLAALKARLIFDDNLDHQALEKLDPDHKTGKHERIYDPLKRDGKKLVRDEVITEDYLKEE